MFAQTRKCPWRGAGGRSVDSAGVDPRSTRPFAGGRRAGWRMPYSPRMSEPAADPPPDHDVTLDDVLAAAARLDGIVHRTPLLTSVTAAVWATASHRSARPRWPPLPEGRAAPEDGVVQGARHDEPDRHAAARGACARRDHAVRRECRSGVCLGRSAPPASRSPSSCRPRPSAPRWRHASGTVRASSSTARTSARHVRRDGAHPRRRGTRPSSTRSTIRRSSPATARSAWSSSRTSPMSTWSSSGVGGGGLIAGVAAAVKAVGRVPGLRRGAGAARTRCRSSMANAARS